MRRPMRPARRLAAALMAILMSAPGQAAAWGATGHRMVGVAAVEDLPAELPAFVRSPSAAQDIGELSRELDRSKGAGRAHAVSLDPGHFLNISDDGTLAPGLRFEAIPPDRESYETALRAAGTSAWKVGWLYHSILETQQQLTKDFAMWRVVHHAAAIERNPTRRAWYRADLRRREALILQTLGRLSHYVADGAQPLHVTTHYNGWAAADNPEGFTRNRIHAVFEGELVAAGVRQEEVRRAMPPRTDIQGALETHISAYLARAWREVPSLYRLEKTGALKPGDPRGAAYARDLLGAGAGALRDLVTLAWRSSSQSRVGWPEMTVEDALAGRHDLWVSLYGKD
ncbi:MAG: S1/P1 Nuclease [Phenylobacterium sp.]